MALIIPAIIELIPWIAAWIALGGNVKSVEKNIEGFGSAITAGPVNTATNAWIKVAVIAGALGFGFWILETKVAHSMGQEVAAPAVDSIHVATPPTFGSSGGYTASAGPVGVHAGVASSSGGTSYSNQGPSPSGGGRSLSDRAASRRASARSAATVSRPTRAGKRGGFND